ncbi:MAG: ribose-phosphate pyrophosphokinase [Planctomycetaceae bacterium]|nr:ribose-phosphate pyrophosphokinase [Planctomycetaceae bacterium]
MTSSHDNSGPRPLSFQPPQGELAILAGSANPEFARAIAQEMGYPLTPTETHTFSDGNVFVRILENVRGRDCYIIQGVHHPVNENFMELLFWIDALKRASAQSVTAVIPYFSYAKGDKKDEPRVSIRARVCADAIQEAGADRCLMMDLHSPQIQGFFQIPVDHLYGRYVLASHIRSLEIPDLVICSPDVGFAKGASAFAKLLGVPVVIGNKERTDHNENAEVLEVIGDVEGRNVVIVDDFTISGGTLISMAELLQSRGAKDVYAAVSHAAMTPAAGKKLENSPIKKLFTTDTIEPLPTDSCSKLHLVSVAPVFAAAIRSIHERTSVSMLFDE